MGRERWLGPIPTSFMGRERWLGPIPASFMGRGRMWEALRVKRQQPVLITDAERSPDDQLRSRQVRYIVMMSVRALCLVAAAVLVGSNAPLLWLWVPLCVVGMVLLPWLAVIIANDRPPKEKYRLSRKLHRAHMPGRRPRTLPTQPAEPAEGQARPRTIDAEP
jgi:hypothetical protein